MKKLLLSLSIVAAFTACKSGKQQNETETSLLLSPNTAYQNSSLTDTAQAAEQQKITQAPRVIEKTTIIYRDAPVKKPKTQKPVFESEPTVNASTTTTETKDSTQSGTASAETGNTNSQAAETEEAQPEKKGMSKAAKGAIIGGVGGAVAGAVIGKNGKGAVIGGIIGAAGGYVLGRKQDKKDGRVQ